MKLFIASAFLLFSAAAQDVPTEPPFFTLPPAGAPAQSKAPAQTTAPTGAPVPVTEVEEPSAAPVDDASEEPTLAPVIVDVPTAAPTTAPTGAPSTSTPTTAPSTAAPSTSSPTKLPTSKAPVTSAPVKSDFPTASNVPSDSPSDAPSKSPSGLGVEPDVSAQCVDNSACFALNLTGACCPTTDNWTLRCCGAPDVPHYQSCTNHSKCAAEGLEDACCPTADEKWLDCCGTVPDECQEEGACPLYSTVQYKLDLAAAQAKSTSNAVTAVVSSVASAVFVITIAFVAL